MNVKSLLGRGDAPSSGEGPAAPGDTGGGRALPAVPAALSTSDFYFFIFLIIIFILLGFLFLPKHQAWDKEGAMLTQLDGVGTGAEEREKTEPLLYFMSHGCSGPTGAQPRKVSLWLAGDSAQDFPVEEAGLRERIPSAAGEKLCRVPMPSITAFSQISSQLLIQLGDHLTLQS